MFPLHILVSKHLPPRARSFSCMCRYTSLDMVLQSNQCLRIHVQHRGHSMSEYTAPMTLPHMKQCVLWKTSKCGSLDQAPLPLMCVQLILTYFRVFLDLFFYVVVTTKSKAFKKNLYGFYFVSKTCVCKVQYIWTKPNLKPSLAKRWMLVATTY